MAHLIIISVCVWVVKWMILLPEINFTQHSGSVCQQLEETDRQLTPCDR